MYDAITSFILGFHGCDTAVAERVFSGATTLKASQNAYDWLGHGVYFWEYNPERAAEYALLLRDRPRRSGARVKNPAVVGAIIDPGRCLNLLDQQMIRLVRSAHEDLVNVFAVAGETPPANQGGADLLQRFLDCAVLEHLHTTRQRAGLPPFDCVHGVFVEGSPIYPTSGFHDKSHIQVCVRNPRCVKGFFRVLPEPEE